MAGRVYLVDDGYAIRGIEPPGLRTQPDAVRLMFWGWVVEIGLKQKDRDLSMGLDKDGVPMRPIHKATREHRHSEMVPGGKGDPSAPPLEPGRQRSRVRSLLTGRPYVDHAEFWWKFDPFTGDSFARILEYQKDEGRDVFGLGPDALRRVIAQSWERYRRWERGKPVAAPRVPGIAAAQPIQRIGSTNFTRATWGINTPSNVAQRSGGLRREELIERMRQPARVSIPGRRGVVFNRILSLIWGGGPSGQANRAAMGPRP